MVYGSSLFLYYNESVPPFNTIHPVMNGGEAGGGHGGSEEDRGVGSEKLSLCAGALVQWRTRQHARMMDLSLENWAIYDTEKLVITSHRLLQFEAVVVCLDAVEKKKRYGS